MKQQILFRATLYPHSLGGVTRQYLAAFLYQTNRFCVPNRFWLLTIVNFHFTAFIVITLFF